MRLPTLYCGLQRRGRQLQSQCLVLAPLHAFVQLPVAEPFTQLGVISLKHSGHPSDGLVVAATGWMDGAAGMSMFLLPERLLTRFYSAHMTADTRHTMMAPLCICSIICALLITPLENCPKEPTMPCPTIKNVSATRIIWT